MTFKHVKFEDSVVMRSLEKLAKEKGWTATESLTKKASTEKLDLAPTDNLLVNIITLCEGLRQEGFDKQANEIETKFFAFKKAQTLYETSSETGEDLIDRAHPKGSHKLEDVDADEAVFETILDQHLQNVKMIDKKPTGKLASNKNILKSVKSIFAQAASVEEQKKNELEKLCTRIGNIFKNVNTIVEESKDLGFLDYFSISRSLERLQNPTIDNLEGIESAIYGYEMKLNPHHYTQYTGLRFGGLSNDNWNRVKPLLDAAKLGVANAKKLRYSINELGSTRLLEDKPVEKAAPVAAATPFDPLFGQISGLKNKLLSWKAFRSISRDPAASKWIDEEVGNLDDITTRYHRVTPDQQQNSVSQLQKEVNEELADINEFESNWIKSRA